MLTRILWFLIFFVTTEGFGLRSGSWGGLGNAGLGWFGALQLLIASLSVLAIIPGMIYLLRNIKTRIGFAAFMIGLLPVYMILVTLARGASGSDVGLVELFTNLLQLKFFLLVYLFAFLVSRRNGLENALQAAAFYAFVTAVFILVIIAFDIKTAVTLTSTSTDVTRMFRAIFPGALLVSLGWLLFFSRYLILGGVINGIASLVCLGATVIQLHRSTLLAVVVTTIVMAYWVFTFAKVTTAKRRLVLGGVFGLLILGGILIFASGTRLAVEYVKASAEEAIGVSGNSGHRANIVFNSWSFIFSDTFGLGLGLDWDRTDDFATYLENSFAAGPTFDSSYANVIIVLGLPGIVLYLWLFLQIAGLTRSRKIAHDRPTERIVAVFLRPFLVFSMIVGLGGDIVLLTAYTAVISLVIVLAVRLQELRSKKGSQN